MASHQKTPSLSLRAAQEHDISLAARKQKHLLQDLKFLESRLDVVELMAPSQSSPRFATLNGTARPGTLAVDGDSDVPGLEFTPKKAKLPQLSPSKLSFPTRRDLQGSPGKQDSSYTDPHFWKPVLAYHPDELEDLDEDDDDDGDENKPSDASLHAARQALRAPTTPNAAAGGSSASTPLGRNNLLSPNSVRMRNRFDDYRSAAGDRSDEDEEADDKLGYGAGKPADATPQFNDSRFWRNQPLDYLDLPDLQEENGTGSQRNTVSSEIKSDASPQQLSDLLNQDTALMQKLRAECKAMGISR